MSEVIDVSVLIATYDRLALLERTLQSVIGQTNALGLRYEIVVVDNHPTVSAREPVEHLAATVPFPIRYTQDTRRNMSTLRNAGIALARGTYVAFIDDDEQAAPDWLDELVGCLRRTGADIAVGPRLAVFANGEAPAYDRNGEGFVRDLHLPQDSTLELVDAVGKPRYGLGTGNSIFVKARCFAEAEPFSIAFGNAGGEDQELFCRLYRRGRKLVWARGAVVTETVLPHRLSIDYRLVRTQREAEHYVTIQLSLTDRPNRVLALLTLKGLIQTVLGTLITIATAEWRSDTRITGRQMRAHGLGKLSWRRPVGYIQETPQPRQSQ